MQDGRYPSCVVGACTSVHADQLRPIDLWCVPICSCNLKKRRALSSTSVSLNKIWNIVFLVFLIRIKPYNTSKIRII